MDIATVGKLEFDKLPKINSNNKEKDSNCIVAYIQSEKSKYFDVCRIGKLISCASLFLCLISRFIQ